MKLQKQPNKSTCFVTALAMVLNIDVHTIINEIGHDGTVLIGGRFTGIHEQEIIDYCLRHGFLITQVLALPYFRFREYEKKVIFPISNEERFEAILWGRKGVIISVLEDERQHAVAWDGFRIFDPVGEIYSLEKISQDIISFYLIWESRSFLEEIKKNPYY